MTSQNIALWDVTSGRCDVVQIGLSYERQDLHVMAQMQRRSSYALSIVSQQHESKDAEDGINNVLVYASAIEAVVRKKSGRRRRMR